MKAGLKWQRVVIVFVCLSLLWVAGCTPAATPTVGPGGAAAPPAAGAETWKIGYLAAVTGSSAFLGEPERDAARLVQQQLDQQGGIVGSDGARHKVEIIIYDTQGIGDSAIPLAKKLISDDKVIAIVGGTVSAESLALVPIVQDAKIPYVSMASSSQIVEPASERHWVFKTAQSNKHTAPMQVAYAKAKGLTKVANLYVNNAYGEDGRNAIRDAAKAAGVEIILDEAFEATDTNMMAQLTKIKASGAQAVLVTAIPPAASVLTKQYRELGLTIPLIQNHGIGMKPFITLSGAENAEGVLFPMGKMVAAASLPDSDPQKAVLLKFIKDYETFTGKPSSTFAGHGWDGLQITLKALGTLPAGLALDEQRLRVRAALENTQGFPGTGGVFNMSATDHVGLSERDVVLVQIKGGDWQYHPRDKW